MKRKLSILIFLMSISTIFLSSCTPSVSSAKKEPATPTTFRFWHGMNGVKEKALIKITDDFMKENPQIKVSLENQSSYTELQQKLQLAFSDPEELPAITQGYPGWLYEAYETGLLTDLGPLLKKAQQEKPQEEPINETFLKAAQINHDQVGLPFSKSTEVLFYNESLLNKYQLKVPKNLNELETTAKALFEKTNGEVYGASFEVLANYLSIGLKDDGMEFNKDFDLTSPKAQALIASYRKGLEENYYVAPSADTPLMNLFCNGKLGFFIASSSREGDIKKGMEKGQEYGVALRPSETNNLQGTDLYLFKQQDKKVQKAAFAFMRYLTSPKVQLFWAQETGYLPVVDSILKDPTYQNKSGLKGPALTYSALKNITAQPNLKNADPAFNELRTGLEEALHTEDQKDIPEILQHYQETMIAAWEG